MKKTYLFFIGISLLATISCNDKTEEKPVTDTKDLALAHTNASESLPIMTFNTKTYDFGTIAEGAVVKHEFTFTNTGNTPLIISNAKGSCGCTVSEWPKDPIPPGTSASLLVTFNSKGKPNAQQKTITLTTNTASGKEVLKIKAMVTPKTKNS